MDLLNVCARGTVSNSGIVCNKVADSTNTTTISSLNNTTEDIYIFYMYIGKSVTFDNYKIKVTIEGN